MKLNLKKSGRTTITKSFSLTASSAEFIEDYSKSEGCTASALIDALVQNFITAQTKKFAK